MVTPKVSGAVPHLDRHWQVFAPGRGPLTKGCAGRGVVSAGGPPSMSREQENRVLMVWRSGPHPSLGTGQAPMFHRPSLTASEGRR